MTKITSCALSLVAVASVSFSLSASLAEAAAGQIGARAALVPATGLASCRAWAVAVCERRHASGPSDGFHASATAARWPR